MHFFSINELAPKRRRGRRRWFQLVNVRFFVHGTPRLIWRCRLFGHRPVVDGTAPSWVGGQDWRWVVCARCGVRGAPQGSLDPATYDIDTPYHGPLRALVADDDLAGQRALAAELKGEDRPTFWLPGPIEPRPTGALGGELVIGRGWGGPGFELKVGNAGSEHTLAARFSLGWLGVLYLHTEAHGQGIQRWLNPTGYESKVITLEWSRGAIVWRLWAPRDRVYYGRGHRPANALPRWRDGELRIAPPLADWLFGKRFLDRETHALNVPDVAGGVHRVVRLPEGDYLVKLQLEHVIHGRRRGRKHRYWEVSWSAPGKGLPTEGPESGRVFGSGVRARPQAVRAGTWAAEACTDIAAQITRHRTSERWEPTGLLRLADEDRAERLLV